MAYLHRVSGHRHDISRQGDRVLGHRPLWFEPLRAWSGALFAIYMVLAYLAISAYGKALLATDLAPRWVAWTHLIFGLLGAVGFVSRIPMFNPP